MGAELLRIGELASRAGVSNRTIDYYTGLGLLTPADRTPGNFRLYDPADVERITAIRQLEAHGLSLDEMTAALRAEHPDVPDLLRRLEQDVHALQAAAQTAGPEAYGLLAAIATRARSLLATALEITAGLPPL